MRLFTMLLVMTVLSCNSDTNKEVAILSEPLKVDNNVNLEVYDYEGLKPFLETTTDTTYVVNFWATWCAPCVKELPYFEQLNTDFSNKKLKVILVSLDFPKKYDSHLKPFIQEKKLKSKVIALDDSDSNDWIPKINENWSGAIPATLIFNKNKRQFYEQTFTYNELETEIKQFLK